MKKSKKFTFYNRFCGFIVIDTINNKIIYQEQKNITDNIGGVQPFYDC